MATSANGWPALSSDSHKLYLWTIPAKNGVQRIKLRNGSAGFLLVLLALWFSEVIEDLTGNYTGGLDDWGYASRPIRGGTTLSNHASGTAEDLNATDHPLGAVGTFTKRQARKIRRRLRWYQRGTLHWGGDYRNRKDEMHFELIVDLPRAEKVARILMHTPRGRRVLKANPGQKAVILS